MSGPAARVLCAVVGVVALSVGAPSAAHADPTVNCEPYGPSTVDTDVAQKVYATAVSMGASAKVLLSAFEAALVESNMNNCSNGDRDSVGVFQQRTSWGTYEQRTDVVYASRSFLTRAIARQDRYSTAGQLAQAVQVSAFPSRYDARESQARSLLAAIADGAVLAEGRYVNYDGSYYRIVGGAPVVVADWAHVGGNPGSVPRLSQAQWATLRATPADGTYIKAVSPGHPEHGSVFRIAGGAPVYVPEWTAMGGDPGTALEVDLAAVARAGEAGPYSHLGQRPVDGTVITASGRTYVVRSGAPITAAEKATGVAVHPDAVANAGGAGVWAHLAAPPAGTGKTEVNAALPARVRVLRVAFPGHAKAKVTWAAAERASTYKVRISKANSKQRWSAWSTVSQPTATFAKLRKRAMYRVQVIAVGNSGNGPTSYLKFTQKR